MRNATYLGLCWAMTLGLVAVAFGQQAPPAAGNDQYLQPPIDAASSPAQQPGGEVVEQLSPILRQHRSS